jgi:hypothetical protein
MEERDGVCGMCWSGRVGVVGVWEAGVVWEIAFCSSWMTWLGLVWRSGMAAKRSCWSACGVEVGWVCSGGVWGWGVTGGEVEGSGGCGCWVGSGGLVGVQGMGGDS